MILDRPRHERIPFSGGGHGAGLHDGGSIEGGRMYSTSNHIDVCMYVHDAGLLFILWKSSSTTMYD